jgi:hypothetical protein
MFSDDSKKKKLVKLQTITEFNKHSLAVDSEIVSEAMLIYDYANEIIEILKRCNGRERAMYLANFQSFFSNIERYIDKLLVSYMKIKNGKKNSEKMRQDIIKSIEILTKITANVSEKCSTNIINYY